MVTRRCIIWGAIFVLSLSVLPLLGANCHHVNPVPTEGEVEGAVEGETEGIYEGNIEGSVEGSLEGSIEGSIEGEGSPEGSVEGGIEGAAEGEREICGELPQTPFNVYLTLTEDSMHSMAVNYQTCADVEDTEVFFDVEPHLGNTAAYVSHATGTFLTIDGLTDGRVVHRAILPGLTPNQTYYFVAGDASHGFSEEAKFRTLPSGNATIRFVTGGDMATFDRTASLMYQAGKLDPMFAVIGGDIAYDNGDLDKVDLWDELLQAWSVNMVTPAGYMIPMTVAIGNHELNGSSSTDPYVRSPFYMAFFGDQTGGTYFTRLLGDNVVLFVLDSNHLVPHNGAQRDWLAAEMETYKNIPVNFAVYHRPLYPCYRPFDDEDSVAGRTYWMPLFDQYHLVAAFENHDHAFKRSHRLKNNQLDVTGTSYLGDGCFGQTPRVPPDPSRWYLSVSDARAHFWYVEANTSSAYYAAYDMDGTKFDQYTRILSKK